MGVAIKEVTTKKELRQFVKFNIELYKEIGRASCRERV